MEKLIVNTDGGARGNPGPSGIGVVVRSPAGGEVASLSKFIGHQTNNFAEYEAVAQALEALKKKLGAKTKEVAIEVRLDSELVAKQLSNIYQVKEPSLFPQYMRVHNLMVSSFPHITFTYIPRAENADADRLANEAMDRGV